jgi:capsular exopolysaccharide synthesis family protein
LLDELADRKSELFEAFMTIRTNLTMATSHGLPRSLAITSTRPAEGKSSTALSLAVAVARSGKGAIIVDGDMRNPSLHKMLGRKNEDGLSSYLSGQKDLTGLIQPTGFDNLDCILAGKLPPNAAELLASGRLSDLTEELLTRYDHVLIDGPPVLGIADAPLIGGQVEGVIYIVEASGMRAGAIRIGLDRLRMTGARIFGIVLSKYEPKNANYGYGYSYDYSYGQQGNS